MKDTCGGVHSRTDVMKERHEGPSDGAIHERNAIITLLCLGVVSLFSSLVSFHFGIGLLWGAIQGLIVDPDLDKKEATHTEYRAVRVFGGFFGAVFQTYWSMYNIIPHRSILSHGGPPPFGWLWMMLIATPIRMIYSVLWAVPIVIARPQQTWESVSRIPPPFLLGIYVGWALQDLVHWVRDYIFD